MFAIIKKEIEERYLLGIIGFALFTFLYIWTYRETEGWLDIHSPFLETPREHFDFLTFIYPARHIHTMFIILFGAIIGFSLFFFEGRRGAWFFLCHRSLSFSRIFMGKVMAGMFIFLSSALPFAFGQIFWFAMPGKMPVPWSSEYVLVSFLPLVWGMAAMLCMLCVALPGLKMGQRLLPLPAFLVLYAFPFTGLTSGNHEHFFKTSFLAAIFLICFFTFHAWHKLSIGVFHIGSWAPQAFFASFLALSTFGLVIGNLITPAKEPVKSSPNFFEFEPGKEPSFTKDGRAVLVTRKPDETYQIQHLFELSGDTIDPGDLIPITQKHLLFDVGIENGIAHRIESLDTVQELYFNCTKPAPLYYFWLKNEDLIVGYDAVSKERKGYLGANGWFQSRAKATPFDRIQDVRFVGKFADPALPWYWIRTQAGTYLWDTQSQQLNFFAGASFSVLGTGEGLAYALDEKSLLRFDIRNRSFQFVPLPLEMQSFRNFILWESEKGIGFASLLQLKRNAKPEQTLLVFVDWDGTVLLNKKVTIPFLRDDFMGADRVPLNEVSLLMCLLPGWELYFCSNRGSFIERWFYEDSDHFSRFEDSWKDEKPYLKIILWRNIALSLCAILFFAIRKKLNWGPLLKSSMIIFLGYPWFAVLLACSLFMAKVRCPVCKVKRMLSVLECEHCQKTWPSSGATVLR